MIKENLNKWRSKFLDNDSECKKDDLLSPLFILEGDKMILKLI
jgi:hypothetical protein